MAKYITSRFNYLTPFDDNRYIIFNSLTGNIMLLNEDVFQRFTSYSTTEEETQKLLELGFYTDINGESDLISFRNMIPKRKIARIWTTSACNANCFYCFEKGVPPINTSLSTADRIVTFLLSQVIDSDNSIHIEWFGGEPLLNPSVIDYISNRLESEKVSYSSFIITNGSLISDCMIRKMKGAWKVGGLQITLDGKSDEYDRIKDYYDRKLYNYEKVIDNIKKLVDNNIHVSVRMNYTGENGETLLELVDDLYNHFGNNKYLSAYVYPVWSCTNLSTEHRYISNVTSDRNVLEIFRKIIQYGMNSIESLGRLSRRTHFCMTCNEKSFAFFPDGTIGKCSEAMSYCIGSVTDGITDLKLAEKWTKYEPPQKCNLCNLLPICLGGCPTSNMLDMPSCYPYKEILPELLKLYVEEIQKRKYKEV